MTSDLETRLRAALKMVGQKSEQYCAERKAHEATRAKLARAAEALRPLDKADVWESHAQDHMQVGRFLNITLGDLRRAATVLKEIEP